MVKQGKPAPDLFLHAGASQGSAPSQCLVIEDAVSGVRAARAAGMTSIGFLGGSHLADEASEHGERLKSEGASALAANHRALQDLLRGI
jgi:beta-phosphoglucomutase-like phosphatase (HAD superfamily)